MKSHRLLHSASLCDSNARPGRFFRLAALATAAVLVTGQIQAQGLNIASADTPQSTAPSQAATTSLPSPAAQPLVSAPVPVNQEEARLTNLPDAPFALAPRPDAAQNSVLTTPAQPQHHALAKVGAITGTVLLIFGAGAFALHYQCRNATGECVTVFRDGGIGLMAGGGALAATGYYFWFRK